MLCLLIVATFVAQRFAGDQPPVGDLRDAFRAVNKVSVVPVCPMFALAWGSVCLVVNSRFLRLAAFVCTTVNHQAVKFMNFEVANQIDPAVTALEPAAPSSHSACLRAHHATLCQPRRPAPALRQPFRPRGRPRVT